MTSSSYTDLFKCISDASTWQPSIELPSSLLTVNESGEIVPQDHVVTQLSPPRFTPIDIVSLLRMDRASFVELRQGVRHEFPSSSAAFLIEKVPAGVESADEVVKSIKQAAHLSGTALMRSTVHKNRSSG